jgi:hypothetical protein
LLKIAKKRDGLSLKAGQNISLPKDGFSYQLDRTKGMEHILVVASDEEDSSIEGKYRELARDLKNKNKSAKKHIDSKPVEDGDRGPRNALMSDAGDEQLAHYEGDISKSLPSNKFSCNKQPSCVSSVSFFNNM